MEVELLIEGYTDEIFLRRCFSDLGVEVGTVYGKRGVGYVIEKASAFATRGAYSPILILADFADLKLDCVVEARQILVPDPVPTKTLIRLAVREIEAWVIASRRELASYLGVPVSQVPTDPDLIADPKQALVNLARASRRPRIRNMFVPKHGVSATVGLGYVDGFTEFMANHWSLETALERSPSFSRFVVRVREVFVNP